MEGLIFISSALQQPRHQKRIRLLERNFDLSIFYFYRKKYNLNIGSLEDRATLIGRVQDERYFYRLFLLLVLAWRLWGNSAERVYCTAIDQALISVVLGKKTYLELGDLYQFSRRGRYLKFFDKFVVPRLSGLVLTSPFYYSGYFLKKFPRIEGRVRVVENKLPPEMGEELMEYRSSLVLGLPERKIRIGIIGSFQSEKPLRALRELIERRSDLELHIYGSGLLEIFDGVSSCCYHGEFKNPEDLARIYRSIDVNYVLYDAQDQNVKLALPNKLYESLAYCVPLLVAKNVALGEVVEALGCGVATTVDDIESGIDAICRNYVDYQEKALTLPLEAFVGFDADQVLDLIRMESDVSK